MTTEAILRKSIRYDRGGKPVEVVIPYEYFVAFIESHGLDLTEDDKKSISEAFRGSAWRGGSEIRPRP